MILRCRRLPSGLRVARRGAGPPPAAILDFLRAAGFAASGDEEAALDVLLPVELIGLAWVERLGVMVTVGAVVVGATVEQGPVVDGPAAGLTDRFVASGLDADAIRYLLVSHPAERLVEVLVELVTRLASVGAR